MTSEGSKRRDFLSLVFITKSISKRLLLKTFKISRKKGSDFFDHRGTLTMASSNLETVDCSIPKAVQYGYSAMLFTNDFRCFVTFARLTEDRCSDKCALPVYFWVLKEEENWLQRLVASAATTNCNFAGTKTYLLVKSFFCRTVKTKWNSRIAKIAICKKKHLNKGQSGGGSWKGRGVGGGGGRILYLTMYSFCPTVHLANLYDPLYLSDYFLSCR